MDEGISLLIGGSTAGAMITLLGQYIAAKMKKTADVGPQPFVVQQAAKYVECEDCLARHAALDKRHEDLAKDVKGDRKELLKQLNGIRTLLSGNDKKAEERSVNLHRRIDPLIDTIADAKGKINNHLEDHRHPNNGGIG